MVTESAKRRKKEAREVNKCELYDMCQLNNIEVRAITEYQIRIGERLDAYVTAKKFFDLRSKRWGMYNDVNELLKIIKS